MKKPRHLGGWNQDIAEVTRDFGELAFLQKPIRPCPFFAKQLGEFARTVGNFLAHRQPSTRIRRYPVIQIPIVIPMLAVGSA